MGPPSGELTRSWSWSPGWSLGGNRPTRWRLGGATVLGRFRPFEREVKRAVAEYVQQKVCLKASLANLLRVSTDSDFDIFDAVAVLSVLDDQR